MQSFYSVRGVSGSQPIPTFQGNPNVAISSINISGGILKSNSATLLTPGFIQVSASAITATGTSIPFEDLEYKWDFGDQSGSEWFVNPVSGLSVNANNKQWGPEAAYCYRNSGTYTITLNIRGKNGGAYVTASTTTSVTVSDFVASGGEFWFSQSGSDSNPGTLAQPFQTLTKFNVLVETASNMRFHFNRGDSWVGSIGMNLQNNVDYSGLRIDAYGSGAVPIINLSSGSGSCFVLWEASAANNHTKSDIVVSNITFTNSGSATANGFAALVFIANVTSGTTGSLNNIYLDNISVIATLDIAMTPVNIEANGASAPTMSGIGLWNPILSTPLTSTVNQGSAITGSIQQWFSFVGGTVGGAASDNIHDHQIYIHNGLHTLIRWVKGTASDNIGGSAPTKNYFIRCGYEDTNDSPNGIGNSFFSHYWLISENYMYGTRRAWAQGNQNNDPSVSGIKDFVVQQNIQTGFTQDGQINPYIGYTATSRDNLVWGNSGGRWWAPGTPANLSAQVYREKIYTLDNGGNGAVIDYSTANAGAGWTVKQSFTDNVIQSTSTTAKLFAFVFANWITGGSLVDRNQYYAPNDIDFKFLFNDSTADGFATWQAAGWDTIGVVANPGWTSPPISVASFGPWPFNV